MKRKKKRIYLVLIVVFALLSVLTACQDLKNASKKNPKFKIEDINWSVGESIIDGERCVTYDVENNSKYLLVEFNIKYLEKEGLSNEEKDSFFNDVSKTLYISKDDIKNKDIEIIAKCEKCLESGVREKSNRVYYYTGIFYVFDYNHMNLVEPDMASIKYVSGDKLYTIYYDFRTKEYTEDENPRQAYEWTEAEIGNLIPKPDVKVVQKSGYTDSESSFDFHAYGMTKDAYNTYVEKCKEAGFTVDASGWGSSYSAKNDKGYSLSMYYNDENESASVTIYAPK